MKDPRSVLPPGTRLEMLSTGSLFEISGTPIGYGGGGIIYPARRLSVHNGALQPEGILYALKECYPVSDAHGFRRSERGEILPRDPDDPQQQRNLQNAKERHFQEKERNQAIHMSANRVLPILEASERVRLTLPGQEPAVVCNAVSVMESLEKKGRALSDCLLERRRFTAMETCRILQQLLIALKEVHKAGFLHLDIQGGNVFLRGTLEDKSDILTLIDFGAARPMTGGRTAPIEDRLIFTSYGFCAPEILLHNDGRLQLGVEADLYSVGCMGLYLLTGHRADPNVLLMNRSGQYIRPNQMRRISCPSHLQARLQEFLARALEKEPENRYHSADEMLREVNELLEALQPAKTILASVKYDAFICYKHGPVDSAAAKTLQQRLEHFYTTRDRFQRRRPFQRVFVDEGELSACANFGQQIRDALANSRWLIVVCSPDTPSSPWVQLEIDTFLEIHGEAARTRILTVLTAGTPETSFPPCLRGDGRGDSESFAADARGETVWEVRKKLRGDALLQIAAAMLGTTFDTLKQRQKIYFLQRAAGVTALFLLAAVGFAAYAVNRSNLIARQAVRIEEEYQNALVNESLFLSEQAEKRLADNDPLGAMELALTALPSAKQDRPVVTEAEFVLGKALGIYKTPNAMEDTVTAVGMIETDYDRFFLDDSGQYLFVWEKFENAVQLWDTQTLSLVRELLSTEAINGTSGELLLSQQHSLMLWTYNQVLCTDYLTGELRWHFDRENITSIRASEDKTALAVFSQSKSRLEAIDASAQNMLYLDVLSTDTGELLHSISFSIDAGEYVQPNFTISPDLQWAAITAICAEGTSSFDNLHNSLYLVQLETGECRKVFDSDTEIVTMTFNEDRLALLRGTGYSQKLKHANATYQYVAPFRAQIEVYDSQTLEKVWGVDHVYYQWESSISTIRFVPYDTEETTGDGLLVTLCDQCILLDGETGNVLREYGLNGDILDIRYRGNGFDTLNTDGSYTLANYSLDTVINIPFFGNSITAACRHGKWIYVQSSPVFHEDRTIRQYTLNQYDDSYTALFDADLSDWSYYDYRDTSDGIRMVLAGENRVCYMDSASGAVLTHEIAQQYGFSPYSSILGISADAQRVYWRSSNPDSNFWNTHYAVYVTDLLTGQTRRISMPPKPAEYITVLDTLYWEEKLLFAASITSSPEPQVGVFLWNLAQNTLTEVYRYRSEDSVANTEIYQWEDYQLDSLELDAAANQVYFATCINSSTPRRLFCVDLDTGDASVISLDFPVEKDGTGSIQWKKGRYLWNASRSMAVFGYGGHTYAVGEDGALVFCLPESGVELQLSPDENSLLLLSEDSVISQYRIPDGACMGSIDLGEHAEIPMVIYPEYIEWKIINESTVVMLDGSNKIGVLLDLSGESLKLKAVLDYCIGYNPQTDRFLAADCDTHGDQTPTIGSFQRYALETLIEKANKILAAHTDAEA